MKPKVFDEFAIGDQYELEPVEITEEHVRTFARFSGDFNPIHLNKEYGEKTIFKGRIAHGHLIASLASGAWSKLVAGTVVALLESSYRYLKPVRVGDEIRVKVAVVEKKASSKYPRGVVRLKVTVVNQQDNPVIEGGATLLVANSRASEQTLASAEAEAYKETQYDLYDLWMKTYQETLRLISAPLTAQSREIQNYLMKAADSCWQLYKFLIRMPLQSYGIPDQAAMPF